MRAGNGLTGSDGVLIAVPLKQGGPLIGRTDSSSMFSNGLV